MSQAQPGVNRPVRRGVNSALSDRGVRVPLNVLGRVSTTNLDYSPKQRPFPVKWTDAAITAGYRTKMTDAIHIEDAGAKGAGEARERQLSPSAACR